MMISYEPQTGLVSAFGIFEDQPEMDRLMQKLGNHQANACHPMSIPVFMASDRLEHMLNLYSSLFEEFREVEVQSGVRNFSLPNNERFIAETYPVIRITTDLRARLIDLLSYLQSFQACMINPVLEGLNIMKMMAASYSSTSPLRTKYEKLSIDGAVLQTRMQLIQQDHSVVLSRTESLITKMESTMTALNTMFAQRDNRLNMEIAQDSKQLAVDSKTNAALNLAVAQQSMEIANATKRDSSSMKSITLLTTIFLPGTFVATLLGTSLVNWTEQDFWKYWAITVPLTLVVLGVWAVYMIAMDKRSDRLMKTARDGLYLKSETSA